MKYIHEPIESNENINLLKFSMPYTEATILEIMRVSSVVPLIVRTNSEPTTVGSYKLPKVSSEHFIQKLT